MCGKQEANVLADVARRVSEPGPCPRVRTSDDVRLHQVATGSGGGVRLRVQAAGFGKWRPHDPDGGLSSAQRSCRVTLGERRVGEVRAGLNLG